MQTRPVSVCARIQAKSPASASRRLNSIARQQPLVAHRLAFKIQGNPSFHQAQKLSFPRAMLKIRLTALIFVARTDVPAKDSTLTSARAPSSVGRRCSAQSSAPLLAAVRRGHQSSSGSRRGRRRRKWSRAGPPCTSLRKRSSGSGSITRFICTSRRNRTRFDARIACGCEQGNSGRGRIQIRLVELFPTRSRHGTWWRW